MHFIQWLDATGNNAVDQVAADAYRRILGMLRCGMKHVQVNDVFMLMYRGNLLKEIRHSSTVDHKGLTICQCER